MPYFTPGRPGKKRFNVWFFLLTCSSFGLTDLGLLTDLGVLVFDTGVAFLPLEGTDSLPLLSLGVTGIREGVFKPDLAESGVFCLVKPGVATFGVAFLGVIPLGVSLARGDGLGLKIRGVWTDLFNRPPFIPGVPGLGVADLGVATWAFFSGTS